MTDQMVVLSGAVRSRESDARLIAQKLSVPVGDFVAGLDVVRAVAQLAAAQGCVDVRDPAVEAEFLDVVVPVGLELGAASWVTNSVSADASQLTRSANSWLSALTIPPAPVVIDLSG